MKGATVNVDIFALYTFSRYLRLSYIRENMYNVKLSFSMPYRVNNIKNVNLNPHEIAYFLKLANIYTRGNVYVHSICI